MTKQQVTNLKIVSKTVGLAMLKLYAVGALAAGCGMVLRALCGY